MLSITQICGELDRIAQASAKPVEFCRNSQGNPALLLEEQQLRRIDWDDLTLDELKVLGESAAFLSSAAIAYLAPRILRFAVAEPFVVESSEFLDTFMFLPYSRMGSAFCSAFNEDQLTFLHEAICAILPHDYFGGIDLRSDFCCQGR